MARFETSGSDNEFTTDTETSKTKKRLRFGVPVAKVEEKTNEAPPVEEPKRRSFSQELADKILKNQNEKAEIPADTLAKEKEAAAVTRPEKPEAAGTVVLPPAEAPADAAAKTEAEAKAESTPEAEIIAEKTQSGEQLESEHVEAAPDERQAEGNRETGEEADAGSTEVENSSEPYPEMPKRGLGPRELGVGEVIRLRDHPVAEGVIPLRPDAPSGTAATAEQAASRPLVTPYQTFSRQPEQQHQSRAEQQPAVPTPEMAAGSGGEVPPTVPPERPGPAPESSDPEEPDRTPIVTPEVSASQSPADTSEGGGFVNPNRVAVPAGERPATSEEVEDALRRNTRVNAQRGVLTGFALGTWRANRRLKKEQKKQAKELAAQKNELRQRDKDFRAITLAQATPQANVERRAGNVEKRFENPLRAEKAETITEQQKQRRFPEANRAGQLEPQQQLEIPADHHVETSAWHSIEIDNKTGKPVEAPAFQYGHEYYRERAQEATPAAQRAAAAGETALVAAALSQAQPGQQPADPAQSQSAQIPDASTQGAPEDSKAAGGKLSDMKDKAQAAGPIWPWAIALVVVIFLLVVLIH